MLHETRNDTILYNTYNHRRRPSASNASTETDGLDKASVTIVWNSLPGPWMSMFIAYLRAASVLCHVVLLCHSLSAPYPSSGLEIILSFLMAFAACSLVDLWLYDHFAYEPISCFSALGHVAAPCFSGRCGNFSACWIRAWAVSCWHLFHLGVNFVEQ